MDCHEEHWQYKTNQEIKNKIQNSMTIPKNYSLDIFIKEYQNTFKQDVSFSQWKSKLFSFSLGSSNAIAATVPAQEIICHMNGIINNDQIPMNPPIAMIPNTEISQ